MKEISIEGHSISEATIAIDFYHGNDFKTLTRPIEVFEGWVVEQEYLEWYDIKIMADGGFQEMEGIWEFSEWAKDKLDDLILEKFVRNEIEK